MRNGQAAPRHVVLPVEVVVRSSTRRQSVAHPAAICRRAPI